MSAKTSPLRPWERRIRASQTNFSGAGRATAVSKRGKSTLALFVLFQDVKGVTMMQLHAHSAENGAHRASRAALFADHLTHISGRHAELEDRIFLAPHGLYFDGCRFIYQSPRNFADQFLYCNHFILGHARAPDRSVPKDSTTPMAGFLNQCADTNSTL